MRNYVPKINDHVHNGDVVFVVESLNLDGDRVVSMNCVLADGSEWKSEDGDDSLVLSVAEWQRDDEWGVTIVEDREHDAVFDAKVEDVDPRDVFEILDDDGKVDLERGRRSPERTSGPCKFDTSERSPRSSSWPSPICSTARRRRSTDREERGSNTGMNSARA